MFGQRGSLRKFYGLLLCCLVLGLAACGNNAGNAGNNNNSSSAGNAGGNISTPASTATAAPVPLTVTSVDITVGPALTGHACGSQFTETYTATFHFPANNAGGTVQFSYTTDNGRGNTAKSLTVSPGQTTATYNFTWSGALPADNTEPGPGGVMVTSPNSLTSQLVAPTGSCTAVTPSAFKVTSIELAASPALTGHACGTQFTETYTATFHIAPNGPGGTIVFQYTTDNGRGSTAATVNVAAGQTSAVYKFYWSGTLPADNTEPGTGIVLMSAPNQGESPSANPTGQCLAV